MFLQKILQCKKIGKAFNNIRKIISGMYGLLLNDKENKKPRCKPKKARGTRSRFGEILLRHKQ